MRNLGTIVCPGSANLIRTNRPAPKTSRACHEAIKRADRARAEIAYKAQFYVFGAKNDSETLKKRGYEPNACR